jgi:hypothetical protein
MSGIGACPNEDDDSRLRRMVFIWASLAGVPSLVIYCAVFTFLGAPLAAVIMFAYLTIVLIDLIAFSMTGRGFSVSAFFDTLAANRVPSAGDHFRRANGFCHACSVGAFDSARRARGLWTENSETLLCRLRRCAWTRHIPIVQHD